MSDGGLLPKLGILAGGGELPARLIAACRQSGRPFHVIAFDGHAEPERLGDAPASWVRLGEAGTGISILKQQGCAELVMAGPVRRPTLKDLRPDWRTTRFFAKLGLAALGDDGLLRAVVRELEGEGFRVVGVDEVLGDILAEDRLYTRAAPDDQAEADIARAAQVARGLGALDVGQAVVVQQGIVLAVEAIEGTDAMLSRCATVRREGPGGVLVKLKKPGQDQRLDLPTIGLHTVRNAHAAGLRGICVEAGGALIVGREAVAAEADRLGLFVLGRALP